MHFDFQTFDFAGADAAPDAPAVVDAAGTLTWGQLRAACDAWVREARAAGLANDTPLVITGHKEAAFLVAMLGCLRIGAPFVPVDLVNPAERIRRITEIVRAPARYDAARRRFEPGSADPAALAEKQLAYVMFTSGSTGEPKGVQIGRESLAPFAAWIRDDLRLGARPVFMDQMLFSFDFSLFNVVGALATGGACVLCERETIARHDAFLDRLAAAGVGVWASTPSFVRQQLLDPSFDARRLPTLHTFVFGAESLTPAVAEALWRRFPKARIVNSYGPTEATCSTTWVEIDPALRAAAPNPFPIGRAKPYATVFIDDGEVCVAGDHVMRGYLNRPDLNAERLFHHRGKRAYRTGDLGLLDDDGLLHFKGRRDDQIKLNGYRIELAEIDAALSALPGVRAGSAVALRRADGHVARIVGVLETPDATGLAPAPAASVTAWRQALAATLPPYMVPAEILVCDRLPTTPTDKIDRRGLAHAYAEARTPAANRS